MGHAWQQSQLVSSGGRVYLKEKHERHERDCRHAPLHYASALLLVSWQRTGGENGQIKQKRTVESSSAARYCDCERSHHR